MDNWFMRYGTVAELLCWNTHALIRKQKEAIYRSMHAHWVGCSDF